MNRLQDLKFPALRFFSESNGESVDVVASYDELTTTTSYAVRTGLFTKITLVTADGSAVRFKSARILHGVGPFWGYRFLFHRIVNVELILDHCIVPLPLEEVKSRVGKCLKDEDLWGEMGDFEEFENAVNGAGSISEIIGLISGAGNHPE